MSTASRIAVGSDTRDPVPDSIAAHLDAAGFAVIRCGAVEAAATPWPEVAEQVGRLVAQGAAEAGVVFCWTGTGVSIAANKVPGIRAALCKDPETARSARRWNGANVLALALDGATPENAGEIVDAFLSAGDVDPDETANVRFVGALERRYGMVGGGDRSREP
jgi:ribose 5-phosphate isomerase B